MTVAGTDTAALVLPHLARQLQAFHTQHKDVAQQLETQVQTHPLHPLLTSIPDIGIGARTATIFLTETHGKEFTSRAHLASYPGLTPVTRKTGTSIRDEHVSRTGNKHLKRAMLLSAFATLRTNTTSQAYYDKKHKQGKRHNQTLPALTHHRILTLYTMPHDATPYHPHPSEKLTTTARQTT